MNRETGQSSTVKDRRERQKRAAILLRTWMDEDAAYDARGRPVLEESLKQERHLCRGRPLRRSL